MPGHGKNKKEKIVVLRIVPAYAGFPIFFAPCPANAGFLAP